MQWNAKKNIIRSILTVLFIAVFVTGCTKNEKKQDYSRQKAEDVQAADMIAKSVEATINDEVMFLLISQTTYKMFEIEASESGGITFTYQDTDKEYLKPFTEDVGKGIDYTVPKFSYTTKDWQPSIWRVFIKNDYSVEVFATNGTEAIMLYPYTDSMYRR